MDAGTLAGMKSAKKITVVLPGELVRRAQRATGQGIAPTVRRGLELVAAGRAQARLRGMRGKLRLAVDIEQLREDR